RTRAKLPWWNDHIVAMTAKETRKLINGPASARTQAAVLPPSISYTDSINGRINSVNAIAMTASEKNTSRSGLCTGFRPGGVVVAADADAAGGACRGAACVEGAVPPAGPSELPVLVSAVPGGVPPGCGGVPALSAVSTIAPYCRVPTVRTAIATGAVADPWEP